MPSCLPVARSCVRSTIAYQLRGLSLFTDLFRHPVSATRLFAYAGQVSAISARIYAEVIGCDVVVNNDTPATMLRPNYFQQYVIPNLQQSASKRYGNPCSWSPQVQLPVIVEDRPSGTPCECLSKDYRVME
jgi:hypothetical protein